CRPARARRRRRPCRAPPMRDDPVEAVGPERAALARLLPVGREHEMLDDELPLAGEESAEAERALRTIEAIGLLDLHPGQRAAPRAQRIARVRERLLLGEEILARLEPFLVRNDAVVDHGVLLHEAAGACVAAT